MNRLLDTELDFEFDIKDGVNIRNIRPLAWYLARLVGREIFLKTGKTPVITSGWRDPQTQIAEMSKMQNEQPELYQQVYAGMIKRGQTPETMPHCEGRAVDWRFLGYEEAEGILIEINAWYMAGVKDILGYPSSQLIVPEKSNGIVRCYHCQSPRQVPDETKYRSYLTATFGRV